MHGSLQAHLAQQHLRVLSEVAVDAHEAVRRVKVAERHQLSRRLTFRAPAEENDVSGNRTLKGAAGGGVATVLGIGGGSSFVLILVRFISMQRAIGTASALAIHLSIAGSVG